MKLNMNLFKGKNKSDGFIALDLTRYTAKAIYLKKDNDNKKLVSKGVSIFPKDLNKEEISTESLKSLLSNLKDQSGISTKQVIVGLGGPEVFGFLLVAKQSREKPEEPITQDEIDNIYANVQKASYNQAEQRWSATHADVQSFEALDLVVTSIKIDDDIVDEPVGKVGAKIFFSVYCSYATTDYFEWASSIMRPLKLNTLTITTNLYAQSKLISDHDSNFIIVDVGKFQTDVGVVFGKNLVVTKTFDIGGDYMSRALATKMNLSEHIAEGKKHAYSEETLSELELNKIGDYLYAASQDWLLGLQTVLQNMSHIRKFPNKMYLSGGGAYLTIINEALFDKTWYQDLEISGDIDVVTVDSDLWVKYLVDELSILSGPQMFIPASISVIKFELDQDGE